MKRARKFRVEPLHESDRAWASDLVCRRWGSARIITRGRVHAAGELLGLVAWSGNQRVGLLTYCLERDGCEIVTLDSLRRGVGVGRLLVEALCALARERGCKRVWAITTNDNLPAMSFYRRLGFEHVATHIGAVDQARKIKPEIPERGHQGIHIRDEVEFGLYLQP